VLLAVRISRRGVSSDEVEYYMLSGQARKEYDMSLEDYVTGKGLSITFEVL
jgi:hypothetical protein